MGFGLIFILPVLLPAGESRMSFGDLDFHSMSRKACFLIL